MILLILLVDLPIIPIVSTPSATSSLVRIDAEKVLCINRKVHYKNLNTQGGLGVAEDAVSCKSLVSESSSSLSSSPELSKPPPSTVFFSGVSNLVCHDDKSTSYVQAYMNHCVCNKWLRTFSSVDI